jgi:outer membrane protein OmpA-like peptidoglycan-associated protein
LYIGGAAGPDFAVDSKSSGGGYSGTAHYDIGPAALLSLGYGFGAFRGEIEESYNKNDVNGIGGSSLSHAGGNARSWTTLFNGFYDFNTGTPWTPYVGAGVGFDLFHASLNGTTPSGRGVTAYNGSDTTFAYQFIGGVSYALSPNLSLTTDYRYLASTDASIKSGNGNWKVENANHIITAGLRWTFGAPATVVQAAYVASTPAPAPVTEYTLLFDWDKSIITDESRATIAHAAAMASQAHANIVLVTGYTDTTGSSEYNQRLSERRAAAVKRELVQQGISSDLIQMTGKGKNDLAVQTPDETREHQNRRAQIILRIG